MEKQGQIYLVLNNFFFDLAETYMKNVMGVHEFFVIFYKWATTEIINLRNVAPMARESKSIGVQ
jgi:hypothetical protein